MVSHAAHASTPMRDISKPKISNFASQAKTTFRHGATGQRCCCALGEASSVCYMFRLLSLSACSYLSWLLSWAGRPPPTCFCSPPPCRGDASRCSLRALSWPRGPPRTGPGRDRRKEDRRNMVRIDGENLSLWKHQCIHSIRVNFSSPVRFSSSLHKRIMNISTTEESRLTQMCSAEETRAT